MKFSSKFYRFFCLFFVLLIITVIFGIYFIDIPKSPRLVNHSERENCVTYESNSVIDVTQPLNIVAWNIFKLQKTAWNAEIQKLKSRNNIILLQEAVSSEKLVDLFNDSGWYADQAYAFAISKEIAGVMTLSQQLPTRVCVFNQNEPFLRLPKTALLSLYSLSNQEQLAIINIHSVNFTFDLEVFRNQIKTILSSIENFKGPIIFAGDFNTWHRKRLSIVKEEFARVKLMQASFSPDMRLTVFGEPLDHIFYRGLSLVKAQSQSTNASDHAWLEARFNF